MYARGGILFIRFIVGHIGIPARVVDKSRRRDTRWIVDRREDSYTPRAIRSAVVKGISSSEASFTCGKGTYVFQRCLHLRKRLPRRRRILFFR
jgi:hypothetical protein